MMPETMVVSGPFLQVNSGGVLLTFKVAADGVSRVPDQTRAHLSDCPGLGVEQACLEVGVDAAGAEYCARHADNVRLVFADHADREVKLHADRGRLERAWSECGVDPEAYQLILGFEDGSLVAVTPRGNIMFVREEGLARIQNVEMVGMGFQAESLSADSGIQARVPGPHHNPFDPASLAANFVARLRRHAGQLRAFLTSLASLELPGLTAGSGGKANGNKRISTPDRFGLNKVIVAVTRHNKIYGIESISGEILWQRMFPGSFDNDLPAYQAQSYLLVQKDGRAGNYAQVIFDRLFLKYSSK